MVKKNNNPISLHTWIWKSYYNIVLIPFILIASVYIGIFFMTASWFKSYTIKYFINDSKIQLDQICDQETQIIQGEILCVSKLAKLYSQEVKRAISEQKKINPEDSKRLIYSQDGAYYFSRDKNDGGAAIYYSGIVQVGEKERQKLANLLPVESLMKYIIKSEPLASSIYLNTFDSLNIIYPYIDAATQYPPKMDIPKYNFYYQADAIHNPTQKVKWTDAYLDPAGHGWIASAIAPVYNNDFLEGVVGIDVTINNIAKEITSMDIPLGGYGVLVGKDGVILALSEKGEKDWGLTETNDYHYTEAIVKDTFKPDDFNLYKRGNLAGFAKQVSENPQGFSKILLNNNPKFVSWSTVSETEWKLLIITPEENVYSKIDYMKFVATSIGTTIIIGMIIFYCIFFKILVAKVRKMSYNISQPLLEINDIVKKIGNGNYYQDIPNLQVKELKDTAVCLVNTGQQLGNANRNLLEAQKSAEVANSMKSQFIANMSHEIRTPMNAILGYASLLKDHVIDEEGNKYIKTIQKSGDTLLRIINDILDLSKIEAGKIELQMEPVNISETIKAMRDIFSFKLLKKNLSMKLNISSDIPKIVLIDEVRLRQILFNLIGNALKFTNAGFIEISVRVENYKSKLNKLDLIFEVKDTGIGIPDEQQELIFEPFKQKNGQSNRKYGGTGLGLSIVKRFVEIMGGSIVVYSKVNKETSFIFTIPNISIGDFFYESLENNESEKDDNPYESIYEKEEVDKECLKEEFEIKDNLIEDLSPELIESMDEILNGLWKDCSKSNRMNDIKKLVNQIKMIAEKYSNKILNDYEKELLRATDSFDLKKIRAAIGIYPEILEKFKNKKNNSSRE